MFYDSELCNKSNKFLKDSVNRTLYPAPYPNNNYKYDRTQILKTKPKIISDFRPIDYKQVYRKEPDIFLNGEEKRLLEETWNMPRVPKPLMSNGTNNIDDLFNDDLNRSTFTFRRYDRSGNKNYVDNPIYKGDISHETMNQMEDQIGRLLIRDDFMLQSVLKDMKIMEGDTNIVEENPNFDYFTPYRKV